jgi:hypothetical protein
MVAEKKADQFGFVATLYKDKKTGKLALRLPTDTLERHGWIIGDNVIIRLQGVRGSHGEIMLTVRKVGKVK